MSEDITRLPRWAQNKIRVLAMRLQEAKEREAAIFANPADTDTIFDRYSDNPRPLPKGTMVSFMLGKTFLDVRVDRDGEFVTVSASEGNPAIYPKANNLFHVEVRP